ncbi:MAG: amidohydrolase family protein [Pseudomonadota bacterium]|nr:amidohydrolase family protein [Pseudomonadota bacterium]
MKRAIQSALTLAILAALPASLQAQDVLIRNATVHTASTQGTLQNADVLVRNGRISAVGRGLAAAGVPVIEAEGRPLTPALFAGISDIGVEEVSGESRTVDSHVSLGQNGKDMQVRPEFDVTLAYNPESVVIPVTRIEGFGWTMVSANPTSGGSFIGGQGGALRFDGSLDPIGQRVLFITLGAAGAGYTGGSRAAQWMILDQLLDEVRGRIAPDSQFALLTPAGRSTLARYFNGDGRIALNVHRASDIRRALRWAKARNVRIALVGASEAWKVAPEIAAAKVPVFIDQLANLPADFDQIAATGDNAARLRAAGVDVAFSQTGDASHSARKVRQLAGNAVAQGLPWEDALAALTRVPAQAFGLQNELGSIAPGRRADLALWSGDPLDVAQTATQVWMDGRAVPMKSRQTELRDRYLHSRESALPPAYVR